MFKSRTRSAWPAAFLLACASAVHGQDVLPRVSAEEAGFDPSALGRVTVLLESVVQDRQLAGAVVGVARGGRIAYLQSVGVQDVDTGTPMTDRSIFRIYSMTKAVTAVAAMILHEEGRFELGDPVSRYLPEFAGVRVLAEDGSTREPATQMTVEHLLLHTAGLSHRSSQEYREADVRSRAITLSQFVLNITAVPLRSDPGTRYRYSASPTVLGRLIEVWSGQSFDAFVAERILTPLGMADTGFWVRPEQRTHLASVYRPSDGGPLSAHTIEEVPFTEVPALMEGAVGLVSTVPDFLRFSQMLLNGGELGDVRILQESTVARMVSNGLPQAILATRRWGTGWGLGNVSVVVDAEAAGNARTVGEYGWDGSAGTEFWIDPNTETVIVTMWQSAPANPGGLRQQILTLVKEALRN